jgi:prepilin-type N-terminal cleavage/methylation domain-containing protein
MKLPANISRRQRAGFTLAEMMIAVTIFLFVVAGILAAHLWGLSMFQFDQRKLNATDWSRRTFGKLTEEIHECSSVQVGNITNGAFQGLIDGEAQQGSALLIYPTSDTTSFIVYFVNTADQTLRRAVSTFSTNTAAILADSVTNGQAFTAQDFSGNVLSNSVNNRVIHVSLDFYQPAIFHVSPDAYQLETSVTRRALQ